MLMWNVMVMVENVRVTVHDVVVMLLLLLLLLAILKLLLSIIMNSTGCVRRIVVGMIVNVWRRQVTRHLL